MLKWIFVVFIKTLVKIASTTTWLTSVENAAPLAPPKKKSTLGTRIKFKIIFTIDSTIAALIIVVVFPIPCNIPEVIYSIVIKIMEKALILSKVAPLEAFGNKIFKIWLAKII